MADEHSTRRVTGNALRRAARAVLRGPFARRIRTGRRVALGSSIGVRLALLVLALGLPFIVYVGVNAERQASLANGLAKQRTLAVAHAVAGRIDDVVADNLTTLALVRHGVTIDAQATSANDALLAKIRDDLPPLVHNVGVWTPDGRNVGLLNRDAAKGAPSIADRGYFRRAVQESTTVIEGPVVAFDDGKPVVVFATPVLGATGDLEGVITLSTDLQQVQNRLDLEGAIPAGTVIAIVNADGVVIARSVDSERWIGKSILDVGKAREHMAQREGVDETLGADRVARISGFTETKRTHWHVFVGMPADAALSAARINVLDTVGLGALSLLLGAGVSAWLGTRIAQPLRRLAYDATLLARGNLAHRTQVAGDDETGVLASTLNRLAQTVEERTRALRDKTAALEEKTKALERGVGDLRAAQEKAEQSEQRLRNITDSIPSMVGYIDRERRYRFNNRYYETWLQRPLDEITGRRIEDVLGPAAYANVASNLDRAFRGERVDFDVEAPGPAGSRFVRGSYIPHFDESGQVIGVYTSSTDITPLKEVERQLERLVQKDTLTGLPNRHAFNDGIAAALRRSQRSGTQVALLFLDVDGFKKINDTLGHAAGDDVLREFARRLSSSVRATDLVARLGGDEFVIVLEGIHTRDECRFVARKIIAAMRTPFPAADVTVKVTTSIGVALGQGGATTPEALLKRADSALYAAKGQGRDTFEIAI